VKGTAGRRAAGARLHDGWIIVATLCVTETITWGIIFYGFPVFLSAMVIVTDTTVVLDGSPADERASTP
jgi:hypothetical protein